MRFLLKMGLVVAGLLLTAHGAVAQRMTDQLTRGLVAVPTGATGGGSKSNFVSWRRFAEEYYGVTYNLYRNGSLLASGLTRPCYDDNSNATPTVQYQVAAVVNGVEQAKSVAVTPWQQYVYNYVRRCPTGYLDLMLLPVYDRNGNEVTSHYFPNDAEIADLDGDGELDLIIKRINEWDAKNEAETILGSGNGNTEIYSASNTTEFSIIEAYKVNWTTGALSRLWWIDVGPNMCSLNSTELNIIAYDWDEDGKAEVVLRGADDMIIHQADGTTRTIGVAGKSYRSSMTSHTDAQYAWTKDGPEYLIYMNGQTGKPYQVMDYPLKRLEDGETNLKTAWGDDYGHRSTKHFFGAPVLDGRHASLFLARGIYTREKMVAFDIDPASHALTQRWKWECNTSGSPWYGNGYHNFIVADVDEDGRDEIVYGSMVIDDNGRGLSTTGYGHGDAQHVSDFDPYRRGLEFFGCLEDSIANYGCNYRNATTSEIYRKDDAGGDTGRALMANFSNNHPGSLGRSSSSNIFNSVNDEMIAALSGDSYISWGDLNFRIYWDGDFCSEILNSPGIAKEAKVEKPGLGRLFTTSGCNMNNDSKNNACFQGDIIGDWREEIILRCGTNLRVYTTGLSTEHDLYTLWHDHQYRQAMVWQMMAYNQPPHLSFFLGELEGSTVAPPPSTLTGRTLLDNGASVTTADKGKHLLLAGYDNMTADIAEGAQPQVITVNAPAWVQGCDNNKGITTTTYHHQLTGAALTGTTSLVKQGWGALTLSAQNHSYSGETQVWQGTLNFDGTLDNSPVWLRRHTTLNTAGGAFKQPVTAEYGAAIQIGGPTSKVSVASFDTLNLGFGSKVVFDISGENESDNDQLLVGQLCIETKTGEEAWENFGPEYLAPVFQFNYLVTPTATRIPLGKIGELGDGCSLDDIILTGLDMKRNPTLVIEDGVLCLMMDEPSLAEAPQMTIVDMVETEISGLPVKDGPYYLPKVGMAAENGSSLSGFFTDEEGNVTSLEESAFTTLRYQEDYESSTGVSGWTSNTSNTIASDATHGQYLNLAQGGGSGSRYAYTSFAADVNEVYGVEWDAAWHPSQKNYADNALILYGGNVPNVSKSWWEWHDSDSEDYVFRMNGGANKGTTYTVVGDGNSFVLADNAWYHFKVLVNQTTGEVDYTVTSGSTVVASGSYTITGDNVSLKIHGIFVNLGRDGSNAKIDNIQVSNEGVPAFTFTKLGTLTLTAQAEGLLDNTVSLTVETPYTCLYDSPDFSTIKAADAAATLGTDLWGSETSVSRWSLWTAGDYTFATAFRQDKMYADAEKVLWANIKTGHPGNRLLQLVEGYGIGQNIGLNNDADINEGTVFHATGLGDERTIIHHRYDLSRGAATKTYVDEYIHADADGNYDYDSGGNFTLQKFTAYIPYDGFLLGDANGDGRVNVADVMFTVKYVLNGSIAGFHFRNANIDGNASINVTDVMAIVKLILE